MLILACDTATATASVALWRDGRLAGESFANQGLTHSVTFMPLVEQMLAANDLKADDITHFAVTTGPGSFTGIRIGLAAVKAMAYAAQKPVLGFSTLEVLAWPYQIWSDLLVCPLLDARNGRVYAAAYLAGGLAIGAANRPLLEFLQEAGQLAKTDPRISSVLFVGQLSDQKILAESAFAKKTAVAPLSCGYPRAGWLAELAARQAGRGAGLPAAELQAQYLALTSAERLHQANGST